MGGGAGVGRRQPPQAGDIARQLKDSCVVNLVKHWSFADYAESLHCLSGTNEYIGVDPMVREGVLGADMV
jgi:hypothetical protein